MLHAQVGGLDQSGGAAFVAQLGGAEMVLAKVQLRS
jgi:hypothetical protein